MRRTRAVVAGSVILLLAAAAVLFLRLRRNVALETAPERTASERVRPLAFAPSPPAAAQLAMWGDGTVLAVAATGEGLWTAGGSGLADGRSTFDPNRGLGSLRVAAVGAWRTDVVYALESGGWGRVAGAGVEEATSPFGRLEVRTFAETPAGDLVVGARQGLFLAPFAAGTLQRLSSGPVRSVALLPGGLVAAGGEKGLSLLSLSGLAAHSIATPDPWIESVGWDGRLLWASTPVGTCVGDPLGSPARLALHARGQGASAGVLFDAHWWAVADGGRTLAVLAADGGRREEPNPDGIRRLLVAGATLFGDAPSGLLGRDVRGGWTLARRKPALALPRPHVNALAAADRELYLGFFDGGLAVTTPGAVRGAAPGAELQQVSGSGAWGVNALLPSAGTLWIATLRGVFRLRAGRLEPVEGPGGAYSLASTTSGTAIGYGQGVLLPGRRLLSAFHGLPGNQAYALAPARRSDALWVGTPTGLARLEGARVTARALPGEGKLPNPWVTALLDDGTRLLVATWGGGVAARREDDGRETWDRFPETGRLRVNAGAMAQGPDGRIWIGTQGEGLWRSDRSGTRFAAVSVPLPSPNVFSLSFFPPDRPDSLFAGTDQGLARIPLDSLDPSSPEAR